MTAKVWIPPNDVGYPPGVTSAAVALWIEDLRQAILEVGLVQTADTGQFNAATFTTTDPGTNSTAANAMADVDAYMVFRFNDALQATHPIFIRISIIRGVGTSSTGHTPTSRIYVGTSTDGAGNITGVTGNTYSSRGSTTGQLPFGRTQSWASYSQTKGFFGIMFNPYQWHTSAFMAPVHFFVERIPDVNGAPSDVGFTLFSDRNPLAAGGYAGEYAALSAIEATTIVYSTSSVFSSNDTAIPYFHAVENVGADMFFTSACHQTPYPVRSNGVGMINKGIITRGAEFDVVVYGATSSHFVAEDEYCGLRPNPANTSGVVAFMFE